MNHEKIAVIFDMDGLIIDSEPLWRAAEISVFKSMGYQFTDAMCMQTMGMRIDSVVKFWHKKYKWENPSIETVVNNIQNKVIDLVNKQGKPLDGVITTIDLLKRNNIPIAIASSSSSKIINAVVDKLNIKDKFDVIHSAENEKNGKPHPAVFNTTATMLNVSTSKCIVLEDSKHGMQAAINAEMKVIVIPEKGTQPTWIKKADLQLKSLTDFNLSHLSLLKAD